jgi:serine/threonine-protein kinase
MTHAATFKPGDAIGPYRVGDLIGVGFMGEVYRAAHVATREVVALKCLQVRHLDNADLVERARREAVALTEIRHSNIVYVHEAGVTDEGVVWMAMELLVGRSLRRVMKEGKVSVPMALHFACEIADGVDAAHELSIVHRDLKPENVFVTDDHAVRVLDLGTAKFFGQDMETTGRAQVFGTVPYMSPEHLAGERVDARTDVYALGMMLYEMIAGEHPFKVHFENVLELGRAQLFQKPRPLFEVVDGLPGYLWALVEKAIAKDRDHRFMSMSELARAVRRARRRYEEERRGAGGDEWSDRTVPRVPSTRRDYMPPQPAPSSRGAGRESSPRVMYSSSVIAGGRAGSWGGPARGDARGAGDAGGAGGGSPGGAGEGRRFMPTSKTLLIEPRAGNSRPSISAPPPAPAGVGGGIQEPIGPYGTQVISAELTAAMVARPRSEAESSVRASSRLPVGARAPAVSAPASNSSRRPAQSKVPTMMSFPERGQVRTDDGVNIPTRAAFEVPRQKQLPAVLILMCVLLGIGLGGILFLRWQRSARASMVGDSERVEEMSPKAPEQASPLKIPEQASPSTVPEQVSPRLPQALKSAAPEPVPAPSTAIAVPKPAPTISPMPTSKTPRTPKKPALARTPEPAKHRSILIFE